MISFLKQYANDIAKILISLPDVKILPTDFGTGIKAVSPTVAKFNNKKYYIELIAEQKLPFYPNNINDGFSEHEVVAFIGIKVCEIVDTKKGDIINMPMIGEIFAIDQFLASITDEKLKTGINEKILYLQEDSVLEEEHLEKINEMWLSRTTGYKTLARKFIYN